MTSGTLLKSLYLVDRNTRRGRDRARACYVHGTTQSEVICHSLRPAAKLAILHYFGPLWQEHGPGFLALRIRNIWTL